MKSEAEERRLVKRVDVAKRQREASRRALEDTKAQLLSLKDAHTRSEATSSVGRTSSSMGQSTRHSSSTELSSVGEAGADIVLEAVERINQQLKPKMPLASLGLPVSVMNTLRLVGIADLSELRLATAARQDLQISDARFILGLQDLLTGMDGVDELSEKEAWLSSKPLQARRPILALQAAAILECAIRTE